MRVLSFLVATALALPCFAGKLPEKLPHKINIAGSVEFREAYEFKLISFFYEINNRKMRPYRDARVLYRGEAELKNLKTGVTTRYLANVTFTLQARAHHNPWTVEAEIFIPSQFNSKIRHSVVAVLENRFEFDAGQAIEGDGYSRNYAYRFSSVDGIDSPRDGYWMRRLVETGTSHLRIETSP